jgi:hypothetical protein
MVKITIALAALIFIASTAVAKHSHNTRGHHHNSHAVNATCTALRQLHAQIGTAGLEAMGAQVGITPGQRTAAITCLRGR